LSTTTGLAARRDRGRAFSSIGRLQIKAANAVDIMESEAQVLSTAELDWVARDTVDVAVGGAGGLHLRGCLEKKCGSAGNHIHQ
jgi:hypothetical protein